jgi:hypothetical protein
MSPPHLRKETGAVSETLFRFLISRLSGRWTKSKNPIILSVIHHCQNPLEQLAVIDAEGSGRDQLKVYSSICFIKRELAVMILQ